jgi:DNA-directed RNA polymerase I, II, and III subunit RPABC1
MNTLFDLDFEYYHRIYENVHTMMETRGYTPKRKQLTLEKYISKMIGYISECEEPFEFLDKLALTFYDERDDTKAYIYFFILDVKMKKADIEHIYKLMQTKNIDKLILIVKEKLTPKVGTILKTFNSQLFYDRDLVTNPIDHVLQPKFEILSKEQIETLLAYYKTDINHFPGIFIDKPVCKWFDLQKGDMIKIIRKNNDISYRAVRI